MTRAITTLALLLALALPVFAATFTTETIKLPTMQCGMCKHRIETKVKGLKGLKSIDVDVDSKTAKVEFDPAMITLAKIEKAIAGIGYDANDTKASRKAQMKLSSCCRPDINS